VSTVSATRIELSAGSQALVIETTPRVRANHPGWTVNKLTPWLDSTDQVRISGWLVLDPQHADQVRQFRSSIWRILPITNIEVWQNGSKWGSNASIGSKSCRTARG
jgi:hypothetical protein